MEKPWEKFYDDHLTGDFEAENDFLGLFRACEVPADPSVLAEGRCRDGKYRELDPIDHEKALDEGIYNHAASDIFSDEEKAIMRYVEKISTDPDSFGDEDWADLRNYLSEEEIVELGIFLFMNLGFHTFFGTLKFYPMFSPDGRLVSQEESERLYGDKPVSLQGEVAE